MAQYDKLINLGLLSQFLTKAKTIFAPKITASGILKGDGAGNVSSATAGTDYVTPAQSLALGLTGASVGDLVRVNAVDSSGKPTSWKHVPLNEIKCNKNLLDNWYFVGGGSQLGDGVFPINQRGQTTYSGGGYGIDRWRLATDVIVNIATEIVVKNTSSTDRRSFGQYCGSPSNLYGKTVTGSILLSNGEMHSGTITLPASPPSNGTQNISFADFSGNTLRAEVDTSGRIKFSLMIAQDSPLSVLAMKLELSSEQTIAHNEGTEANPVWVLNEIPDYGEELAKCQRYLFLLDNSTGEVASQNFIGYAHSATQLRIPLALPVSIVIKKNATVTIQGDISSCFVKNQNSENIAVTSITAFWYPVANQIMMIAECSNATFNINAFYRLQIGAIRILFSYEP